MCPLSRRPLSLFSSPSMLLVTITLALWHKYFVWTRTAKWMCMRGVVLLPVSVVMEG